MNFRLIVEYHDTGIITEQYFPDMEIHQILLSTIWITRLRMAQD